MQNLIHAHAHTHALTHTYTHTHACMLACTHAHTHTPKRHKAPLTSDVVAAMVQIALLGLRTVDGKAAGLCGLLRKWENDQLSLSALLPVPLLPVRAGTSFSRGKYFLQGWLVEKLMSFIPLPEERERTEQRA